MRIYSIEGGGGEGSKGSLRGPEISVCEMGFAGFLLLTGDLACALDVFTGRGSTLAGTVVEVGG